MVNATAVAVGLDVHKSSVRLCALRADERSASGRCRHGLRGGGARIGRENRSDARSAPSVEVRAARRPADAGQSWGVKRRKWLGDQHFAHLAQPHAEHSSGEKREAGSITRIGYAHVRRLLVEAAWHSRLRPRVGYELARRQRGQDLEVLERAWRAQQRLHDRWRRMAGRGKPHQKIVVACVHELAGFVWAIATHPPLRAA